MDPHPAAAFNAWLGRLDPGVHRRIKGLRLVTAFVTAALAGAYGRQVWPTLPGIESLGLLAGSFALWASVSEGRDNRAASSRDLAALCLAAVLGGAVTAGLTPWLAGAGPAVPELTLVLGAFAVGWGRRFGALGSGLGSQFFIGQLLAYGAGLGPAELPVLVLAGAIAAPCAIVPRLLSGPAEHPWPALAAPEATAPWGLAPALAMGLQAACAALLIVALNAALHLPQSVWAMAACTYVVTGTAAGTVARIRMRVVGTLVGVPLGMACLPVAEHAPLLVWMAAALAMIVYAMALPERYDIACGAYSFTLVVTLAATGSYPLTVLAARLWETVLGGLLGLAAALLVFPLHAVGEARRQAGHRP